MSGVLVKFFAISDL